MGIRNRGQSFVTANPHFLHHFIVPALIFLSQLFSFHLEHSFVSLFWELSRDSQVFIMDFLIAAVNNLFYSSFRSRQLVIFNLIQLLFRLFTDLWLNAG